MDEGKPTEWEKAELFKKENHTQLKYNPIRPIKYPSTERTFLRDESCQSNIIGKDNGKILGIFCYDAKA